MTGDSATRVSAVGQSAGTIIIGVPNGALATPGSARVFQSPITMTHVGNFTQGQNPAQYTISVSNVTAAATSDTVTVTDTLPVGTTPVAMGGPGWTCTVSTCTRSDTLAPGGTYPPIILTIGLQSGGGIFPPSSASSTLINDASASGGLSGFASDVANVLPAFNDVSSTDSFLPAIDLMREYGITSGCGTTPPIYCPGDNITRGQMAVFIVRAVEGGDTFSYTVTPYFTDVPASNPYFKWIQAMRDLGITTGCGAAVYCPDDPVTRAQMAVFIIRARYGATTAFNSSPTPQFTDVPASNIFFPWIQKMKQVGITTGCGNGIYCPNDPVTRGQMAVFIMRGAFNQLLPAGSPVLVSVSPAAGPRGQTVTVSISGQNTNFVSGTTQVTAGGGVTAGTVTVLSATSLTAQLLIPAGAAPGPISIVATTGAEEAALPNGFVVQ